MMSSPTTSQTVSIKPGKGKRKAEEELSTNAHTVKARARVQAMDAVALVIAKAKAADQGAKTYAKKRLRASDKYAAASEAEKTELEAQCIEEVIRKR